jgi:predicted amidohydrolase
MVTEPFRAAAVEFNAGDESLEANVAGAVAMVREAAQNGARLIVLPETAASGYDLTDPQAPHPFYDTIPGVTTEALAEVTREFGCYVAVGIAEFDPATGLHFNGAALMGPDGLVGAYRKNGLNAGDQNFYAPGNTGHPVWDTELGRVCIIICFDDTFWEPARLSAIKGADIIAYPCMSARFLVRRGVEVPQNHSTIAAVQEMCAWNGLALVASDRNNADLASPSGPGVFFPGAASIWQATGEKLASAPVSKPDVSPGTPGAIIYADIDPAQFDNEQKRTLGWRRPELYADLGVFKAPTDSRASAQSHRVRAAAVQVKQVAGDRGRCMRAVDEAVTPLAGDVDLVVLPAFTFTGPPADADAAAALAEPAGGDTEEAAADIARRLGAHVVASHVEHDGDDLFHRAILMAPDGTLIGAYRQAHLDPVRSAWATGGDDLPVFSTAIGRIGLLLCEDARFPEAAGVMAVRRADIIAMPTWWDGSYGGPVQEDPALYRHPYPANAMCLWYALAKMSQAYTVVANSVGQGAVGDSGIFTLNPVDSDEVAVTAPTGAPGVARLDFTTLGDPSWWWNQERLIISRRVDLVVPAILPRDSDVLARWRDAPGFDIGAWARYAQ